MSGKKANTKKSRTTKKIIAFAAITIASTIAISAFAVPSAQATYTDKETTPAPVQVNETIELADIAPKNEVPNLEEVEGSAIAEAASEVEGSQIAEAASEAEGSQIAEAAGKKQNNSSNRTATYGQSKKSTNTNNTTTNTTTGSNTNTRTGTNSTKKNTTNTKSGQSGKNTSSKSTTGSGFTKEKETQSSTSSAPVKLSQAAPYYYSNVLSATEKNLYNLILDGMNTLSGQISLGTNVSKTQIDNAFNAVVRDQSQIFWVGEGYTVSTRTTYAGKSETKTYTIKPVYTMTSGQVAEMKAKLDSAVNSLLGSLNGGMSQFDIELAVHDHLVRKVNYNTAAVRSPKNYPKAYTAYGALVDGSAVCEGYAKAFQLVLNKVGIQTTLVSGKASGSGHMWSMAKIDGAWYHVDVTFDDPSNGSAGAVMRNYFNLSAAEIKRTHAIANRFSYPNATSTGKNYFNAKGLSFASYNNSAANKLYNEVVRAVNNKNRSVQIRVGGSMNSALSVLKNSKATNGLSNIKAAAQKATGKSISRFTYSTDASLGIITVYLSY